MKLTQVLYRIGNANKTGLPILLFGLFLSIIGLLIGSTATLQYLFAVSIDFSQLVFGIFLGFGVIFIISGVLISIPDKSLLEIEIGTIGILFCTSSILVFFVQFPENWNMYQLSTIATVGILYAIGFLILLTITFHAMVNFRIKNGDELTITHRYDSMDEMETSNTNQSEKERETTPGGVGFIGDIRNDPKARETYGSRKPMTKEDREKYSSK